MSSGNESPRGGARVSYIPFVGGGAALVRALRIQHPGAAEALYDRYADRVDRLLARVLGPDDAIPDLIRRVFLRALETIGELDDPERLGAWLIGLAVGLARAHLRDLRSHTASDDADGVTENAPEHGVYRILDGLPPDDRIAFALRIVDGMSPIEIAAACRVSLRKVRRRLRRAEARFVAEARAHPAVAEALGDNGQWTIPSLG